MQDTVTFLRHREHDQGQTGRLPSAGVGTAGEWQFYCRRAFDPGENPGDRNPEAGGGTVEPILDLIARHGGGLLVERAVSNDAATTKISLVAAAGTDDYAPPQRVTVLQPGYPPQQRPLNEGQTELVIPADAHLLLPVDRDAEARLQAFQSDWLNWFAPDFGTLMLTLRRKPDLDFRVTLMEEQWEQATAGDQATPENTPARNDLKPWLLALILLTIGIGALLAIGGAVVYGKLADAINHYEKQITVAGPSAENPPAAGTGGGQGPEPPPASASPPGATAAPQPPTTPAGDGDSAGSIRRLADILRDEETRRRIPDLEIVWNAHFSKIEGFKNPERLQLPELLKEREFLAGIFQLELLRLDADRKGMLAFAACHQETVTKNKFIVLGANKKPEPIFKPGVPCPAFDKPEIMIPGITELTEDLAAKAGR